MANWSKILDEVQTYQDQIGKISELKSKSLKNIATITGRNVIAYYSGWLQNASAPNVSINDMDCNALMNAIYGLDKEKGLALVLHTPGGDIAATESIVNYIQSIFPKNVIAIVPQLSMSGGTMIAMSCNQIIMGKHSSLGPIDPQIGGVACQAVLDEFESAKQDVMTNSSLMNVWNPIIAKYHPTFIGECHNSIKWSEHLADKWLKNVNPAIDMNEINKLFISHSDSFSHSRHIPAAECKSAGLNIVDLEDDHDLQDAVLSLHHCYMIMFDKFKVSKIVENNIGGCYIQHYTPAK